MSGQGTPWKCGGGNESSDDQNLSQVTSFDCWRVDSVHFDALHARHLSRSVNAFLTLTSSRRAGSGDGPLEARDRAAPAHRDDSKRRTFCTVSIA
jgi:hypothetical protein